MGGYTPPTKGNYSDDNAPWMQQKQETEQVVLQHPGSTPWYFAQDFSWWWTGVFVPIVIAWIVNRAIKQHNKKKKHDDDDVGGGTFSAD